MARGGSRQGAGRPKGAPNKRTAAVAKAVERASETLADAMPGAFAGDAHAYLMSVYKDPAVDMKVRVDAAKAAAKYEKPALSSITATINHQPSAVLDDNDLDRRIADLEAQIVGRSAGEEETPGGSRLSH